MKESLISIDPGSEGTGVVVWIDGEIVEALIIRHTRSDWFGRCIATASSLGTVLTQYRSSLHSVYCEMPAFMEGTAASRAAATTGSVVKLAFLVGMFAAECKFNGLRFEPVPVNDWKGQLPKPVVERRIQFILGEEACRNFRSHIYDAVGIGLYIQGRFKP